MDVLDRLRGGLVASCQPVDDGPLDRLDIVAAMAEACVAGGAVGLRIEGVENLRAVRSRVRVPIIGLVKSDLPDSPVRITVRREEVRALIAAGADIIAYDATGRPRPDSREAVLAAILEGGAIAMADCTSVADAQAALASGAQIVGTTLSGYTGAAGPPDGPDLALVRAFAGLDAFVMAEGRFDTPGRAAAAMTAGADAVTVGTALTRLEQVTEWFASAIALASAPFPSGFAVDLGGTKVAAARIEGGRIEARVQEPTRAVSEVDDLVDQLDGLLGQVGYSRGRPLGLAVTGRVSNEGRWSAVNAGTLPRIVDVPLAALAADRMGPLRIGNDAQSAALAEARIGAGIGARAFAYITVSTGVGGGFVTDGRPVVGDAGLVGHVGFMSSPHASRPCGSGRRGTVESVAGGRAIAAAAAREGHDVDARAVFAAAAEGAAWADRIVDIAARAIATLCGDLRSGLGIDRVALGGSIGLAPGFLERVAAHLAGEPALFRPDLVAATLGQDSALIGALLLPEAAP